MSDRKSSRFKDFVCSEQNVLFVDERSDEVLIILIPIPMISRLSLDWAKIPQSFLFSKMMSFGHLI